jgi:hypothetical protein
MFYDGTKAGNQTIMPLLLSGQFFLTSHTPLNNTAEDTVDRATQLASEDWIV